MSEPASSVVVPERVGVRILEWMRESDWTGGVWVFVSTRPWTGQIDPRWVLVDRVSSGATPYPVKGRIPGAGNGQWGWKEVLAVAMDDLMCENESWPRHLLPDAAGRFSER